jgi:arylsulfatase A-like enzyme
MNRKWSFNVFIDKAVSRAKLEGDSSISRPNILFITIDTLRADHLSAYGYTKIRTENINRLAEEGVLFEQMIAQSSWTKSSFGSIWTSLYPSQHKANSRDVYQSKDRWVLLFSRGLREDVPTMAGLFSDAGYVTVGLNTNGTLRSMKGLNRGFQLYLDMLGQDCINFFSYSIHWALLNHISPSTINLLKLGTIPYLPAEKLRHLSNRVITRLQAEGKPFFLWVHFMDPHIPYYPREKFAAKLIEYALTRNPAVLFINALYMDMDRLLSESDDLPLMKKSMTNLYDGEVLYADRNIGEMLNKLRGSGLLSSTLVVLTSDHGEELFDHGTPGAVENLNLKFYNRGYDHGHTMYDELLRVPLIMRFPNKQYAKQRVESIVQHIDLLPTLLAFAGISAESVGDSFEGINLLPYLRGGEKFPARHAKSEFNNHGPELKQIRSTSYKLIYKMFDKSTEFYHLASDPLEQNNIAGKREEPYERMFSALQSWIGRMPKESPAGEAFPVKIIESPAKHTHKERTKKLMDRLKALGYVQ